MLAFFGSLCPAILFNVDRKKFLWIGLSGSFGWLLYSWAYKISGQVVLSTFVGAVAVGIYSEIAARTLKSPATIFSISGIFPLVPGIGAYNTVQFMVENRLTEAAVSAVETLSSAGSIALGIMLISAVFKGTKKLKERRI